VLKDRKRESNKGSGELEEEPSTLRAGGWLNAVEGLSIVGAVGGVVASAVLRQFLFAAVPLSVALGVNVLNRKRLVERLQQEQQVAIATLTEELRQELQQEDTRHHTMQQQNLDEQVATLETLIGTTEEQSNRNLRAVQNFVRGLSQQQKTLSDVVEQLRSLEEHSQEIHLNPHNAEAYYNRGNTRFALENIQGALEDYTEAIRYDAKHAQALRNRSTVYCRLGDAKAAIQDARRAAKLFFDADDMVSYQQIVDETKKLYDLTLSTPNGSEAVTEDLVSVGNLFSV